MIDLGAYIKDGDGVWWSQGAAEPDGLVAALVDQIDNIGAVRAFSGLTWNSRLVGQLPAGLSVISYGGLGELRRLSKDGLLDVVPCHYSALPRMFRYGQLPNDVGLVQVSPPDAAGTVSLGIGVDYVADALPHTSTLIAEINRQMPSTVGTRRIPLTAFAATVETDRPLPNAPVPTVTDCDRTIAAHVAELIEDGATLQIGVGVLPSAVLDALHGHRDLGVHSGTITDGILDLIDRGVITGAKKEIDQGLVVTGSALGSEDLYKRLVDYPVLFCAASYTHAPATLSRLGSFVSVNSAIEVDLLGQVGAEVRSGVHIGAVGGQVDFSRAAALTGSLSIIALRAENHGLSTVRNRLLSGAVTTGRADVDAVVTEYGVARLTGCTIAERARRLIEVAAPRHRESLERELSTMDLTA